jgi:hypothetical protein
MNIKEFAEKFIKAEEAAIPGRDFNALEQIESPNIVIHQSPVPDLNGFEAHKQYIQNGLDTSTNVQQDWGYVVGDGNVAVVSLQQKGTLKVENPIYKIPAGSTVNSDAFFVLRRENDKIAEIWIKGSMDVTPPSQ